MAFLPLVSVLPAWCGVAAGLGALALQLVAGGDLLGSLLRVRSDPPPGDVPAPSVVLWLDEERPFLLDLGGVGGLVATAGLLRDLSGELQPLAEEVRRACSGPLGTLLPRALALPCLLRAFHAVTGEYARLRGGSGALRMLGQALLLLARVLEAPAAAVRGRFLARGGGDARSRALALLADRLARYEAFPAWMEALAPLAPLSVAEVRGLAAGAAARGGPPENPLDWGRGLPAEPVLRPFGCPHPPLALRRAWLEDRPPPAGESRRAAWTRTLPLVGLVLGVGLALLPGGYLALPVLLLATGLALRVHLELPLEVPRPGDVRDLVEALPLGGQGLPVRLEGRLGPPPSGFALPDGLYLEDGSGSVILEGLPSRLGGEAAVTGWLLPAPPRVVVGTVEQQGCLRRLFPRLRRLAVALELGALGAAWLVLQAVGR